MKLRLKIRRPKELKVFDSLSLSMVVIAEILLEVLVEVLAELAVELLIELFIEILAENFKVKISLVVYYLGFSIN